MANFQRRVSGKEAEYLALQLHCVLEMAETSPRCSLFPSCWSSGCRQHPAQAYVELHCLAQRVVLRQWQKSLNSLQPPGGSTAAPPRCLYDFAMVRLACSCVCPAASAVSLRTQSFPSEALAQMGLVWVPACRGDKVTLAEGKVLRVLAGSNSGEQKDRDRTTPLPSQVLRGSGCAEENGWERAASAKAVLVPSPIRRQFYTTRSPP